MDFSFYKNGSACASVCFTKFFRLVECKPTMLASRIKASGGFFEEKNGQKSIFS